MIKGVGFGIEGLGQLRFRRIKVVGFRRLEGLTGILCGSKVYCPPDVLPRSLCHMRAPLNILQATA